MKLANAPGHKLARQRGALARFPRANGRARSRPRLNARIADQRIAEQTVLISLCAMEDNVARGIKTKKSRAHLAKLGRND